MHRGDSAIRYTDDSWGGYPIRSCSTTGFVTLRIVNKDGAVGVSNTKRIGVDLLLLSQFTHTGVVTYALEIVPRLIKLIPEVEWYLYVPSKDLLPTIDASRNVHVREVGSMKSAWAWKLFGASYEALKSKLDLMFFPTTRVPVIKTAPSAVFVHDLGFIQHPEYLKRGTLWKTRLAMRLTAKTADIILTNSEFTRYQFAEKYGVPAESIWPTGLGFDDSVYHTGEFPAGAVERILSRYDVKQPYVLYLGMIQGRKNLVSLIRAVSRLREWRPDVHLVLAGKKGWNCDEVYAVAARHPDLVRMTGAIDAADMRALYRSAECLVMPSIYEGFGIPLVEAMACGTPVIASNTSALPEVVGEAGLYFNPLEVGEIRDCLLECLRPATRARMVETGLERCKSFTWDECANKTASVIRTFLELGKSKKGDPYAYAWNHGG